jgi:Protein of unknown function (DUF3429)
MGLLILIVAERFGGIAVWLCWAYAALILSFLGGVWWGIALSADRVPGWLYPAAVVPTFIALGSFVPIAVFGSTDFTAPMIWIGGALLISPLVDVMLLRSIAFPQEWLRLRWHLSIGLGAMTMLIGLWA